MKAQQTDCLTSILRNNDGMAQLASDLPTSTLDKTIFSSLESEARGYCRHFDVVFSSASGSVMFDRDNCRYIDFLAACGALNYGHNDPDMSKALVKHILGHGLSAALDLYSTTKGQFLETFRELILEPRGLDYRLQFTGPTGTNAVEAAMKLARKVTGRHEIIAFTNGFHGVSMGALAATANQYHRMGLPLPGITHFPYDDYLGDGINTASYLEKLLLDPSSGMEAPAAILLETVQGEGGLNVASPQWLRQIETIAHRHGALLIVDDIQAGCGRTGTFFSFEKTGIQPDLVTLSKSISGYGLPMALLLIKPEYDQWRPAEHNGTFRGNTHAFVTATVALEKFWRDDRFSQSIDSKACTITQRLLGISRRVPGTRLKGRGMMQGLALPDGKLARKICQQAFCKGLLLETSGPHDEVIKIFAPLTISPELLEDGLSRLCSAVFEVAKKHSDSEYSPVREDPVAIPHCTNGVPGQPLRERKDLAGY